jgi:hypothetical protein
MKDIVRVYPIRTTKKEWDIPLFCYHNCTKSCSHIIIKDESDIRRYILVDNPNYINNECPRNNKLEKTFVPLHSFNIENPTGGNGLLYDPNMIVIPDKSFYIELLFPLSIPVYICIDSQSTQGVTLSELIHTIKIIYKYIYEEEERTSTPRTYNLTKSCSKCSEKKIHENISYVKDIVKNKECSICYTEYENSAVQLNCKHIFHYNCILRWLNTSNTCPLCRSYVINCDICDGSGVIHYNYTGSVIPLEYRGNILNRNTTDGIFGIYGYDFEDLIIENMHYNRQKKTLNISISS